MIKRLTELASTYDRLEGNCVTYNDSCTDAPELVSKQENLRKFAVGKKAILEIGFNAGHSACLFLEGNPDVHVVSVDIGFHTYTRPCGELMATVYGERFSLMLMDSIEITKHDLPELFFDGIHVDGYHSNFYPVYDLISCLRFTAPNAEIIIDDTQDLTIRKFADYLITCSMFTPTSGYAQTSLYEHTVLTYTRPRIAFCSHGLSRLSNQSLSAYCKRWNIAFSPDVDSSYDYIVNVHQDVIVMNDSFFVDYFLLLMPEGVHSLASSHVSILKVGAASDDSTRSFTQIVSSTESYQPGDWLLETSSLGHYLQRNHVKGITKETLKTFAEIIST